MKIKDLAKYKTLDITQLSGSPWNTAEKVLGLDSGDTVVMANRMDDEAKQYTDEAIASALTSYYTKDEVDEIVEDIDVTEQLTNYYTKSEVDTANAAQDERIENNENDIADLQSGMVSKSELETAMADETARTESTYAKPSDIPDLTPYATKGWVESKTYVNGAFVDAKVNEAIASETARTESVYAKKTDIPDMGEYATENYVDAAIQVETARTESVYAKKSEIPSLDGYATEQYVNDAIATETARTESTYLKEHQSLADYYTKGQVNSRLQDKADRQDVLDVLTEVDALMANETARTENVYAKKSEIPSLNGYATEAWVEGKGYITGVTVDDELTSGSTNAVQSKAIYDVLNGVTSSTQMEISSVDSTIQLRYRFYGSTGSSYMYANFKEVNIDGYYVIDLGDLPVGEAENINQLRLSNIIINGTYYGFENYSPNTSNLGQKVLVYPDGANIWVVTANLGDTYDYYLVLNTNENYVFLSATLPVITEITDHKANLSDLPTAQDGSGFKQYVYNGDNTKQVVSRVGVSPGYSWGRSGNKRGEIENTITSSVYPWNSNAGASSTTRLNIGSEYVPGIKSIRDSAIIDKADQALYGFTEQITLTPTSASTDYISYYGTPYYLSETNDPRYLVYYFDGSSYLIVPEVYLSGVKYAIKNAPSSYNGNMPLTGIYQLAEVGDQYNGNSIQLPSGNPYYIIIDKELLTLEIVDSLTITRAKNIQEALNNIPAPDMSDYVSKDELTGSTEQQAIEIGADDSATISIYGPNGLETINLKSTSVNKYKVLDISGWATSTNVWPQYFSYSGISQMGFQDFVMMQLDTPYTLTQGEGNHSQITFSGTSPTYLVLNIEDNTVYVSDNLPSVAVEVPGVLDDYAKTTDIPVVPTNVSAFNNDAGYLTQHQSLANYYNKTEIDNMVGDIESLLANI